MKTRLSCVTEPLCTVKSRNSRLTVPNKALMDEVGRMLRAGKHVTFRIKGYSMRPFLENARDLVELSPLPKDAPVNIGDVVLAETRPDIFVLHRIIDMQGTLITLMGDGNIRGTEHCQRHSLIGRATAFYRKGRSLPDKTSGLKWRLYSWVWLHLNPFRRPLLAICKRLPFSI